ncbi:cytochrome P450 [Mucidula mucida]|nr:cytochrome P450 [Mucidula mucida]
MLSATGSVLSLVAILIIGLWFKRKRLPKPPGPPGLPIIGNLLDMPLGVIGRSLGNGGKHTARPLISLSVGPTTVVVINTHEKAKEILDKKGTTYSSRPYLAMAGDLMGWQKSTGLLAYGPAFKQSRRQFHLELGTPSVIRAFWPQAEFHARKFLELCTDHPERLVDHCFQHSGAVIFRIAYGYTAKNYDDEWIKTTNDALHTFNTVAAPGAYLVNQFPFLRHLPDWFPGAGFKRTAKELAPQYLNMIETPFNFVKKQLAAGTAEESFTAKWLKQNISSEDEEILLHGAGALLGAGAETTAITIHCFFLMMALHPEAQKKAQAEIDAVCGRGRLPTFEDRKQLPFVDALIREVTRMHPAAPTGIPHTTIEDDVHDGYFIPKGSIVFANIWCKGKWLVIAACIPSLSCSTQTASWDRILSKTFEYLFGFGRRLCPARLLADASLYITIAMSLSAFDISPVKDKTGMPIIPALLPIPGTISALTPFDCNITPRFAKEQHDELIRH